MTWMNQITGNLLTSKWSIHSIRATGSHPQKEHFFYFCHLTIVFLLLARQKSNKFGSALASSVGSAGPLKRFVCIRAIRVQIIIDEQLTSNYMVINVL